jgi:Neuraminidase (sialidase)
VWKLEKALDILREHKETMRDLMSKAKEFEEMEIEEEEVTDREEAYAEYIMSRGDMGQSKNTLFGQTDILSPYMPSSW